MLLKFKKEAFILAILGISFALLYATLLFIDIYVYHLDFLKNVPLIKMLFQNGDFGKMSIFVLLALSIVYIIKPVKATSILLLIASIPSYNVLLFVSAIITLTEISRRNAILKEAEKKEVEENTTLEESNPLDNYVLHEKKEIPTHVEFTSSEQNKITAAIALGAIYLCGYLVLLFFIYRGMIPGYTVFNLNEWLDGPQALAFIFILFVWLIAILLYTLFLVAFLVPLACIIFNIVVSGLALNKKSYKYVKIMKISGYIGLTIFNSLAALSAIQRYNSYN